VAKGAAVRIEAQVNHFVNEHHAKRGSAAGFIVRGGQLYLLMTAIDPPSHASETIIPTSPTRGETPAEKHLVRRIEEPIEKIIDMIPFGTNDRHGESIRGDAWSTWISELRFPFTRQAW
jgi:hypothetical protein